MFKAKRNTLKLSFENKFQIENFDVIRTLGSGLFGDVYLVKDKRDGQEYALKVYKQSNQEESITVYSGKNDISFYSGSFLEKNGQNRQEIDFLQRIHHPNIIRGLGAILTEKDNAIDVGIVMEVASTDLENYIYKNSLSKEKKVDISYDVLCGINFIHDLGYLHCDLKTDNILIKNNIAKISDPGYLLNTRINGDYIPYTSFCNSLSTRAPEFIAIFNWNELSFINAFINGFPPNEQKSLINIYTRYRRAIADFYEENNREKISVKNMGYGEIYSFAVVMLDIYLSPNMIDDYTWYNITFNYSILPYEERLQAFRELEVWPNLDDNIPEMDELLAKLLTGYPNEREKDFKTILSSNLFENYGYHNFRMAYKENKMLINNYICRTTFIPVMKAMANYSKVNNMYLYHLSASYALFHKILQYFAEKFISGIDTSMSAGIMSIFFTLGRTANTSNNSILDIFNHISAFLNIIDKQDKGTKIIKFENFIQLMEEVYMEFNGIVTYKHTSEYGSNGSVDCMALKYYTKCEYMVKYTPRQFVVMVENKYIEDIVNKRIENQERLPKNTLVKVVYDKIINYFKF